MLFSVVPTLGTRGNGHKLGCRRFRLNMRKYFAVQVLELWCRLPVRLWNLLLGDVQKPPGCGPGQLALGGPA